MSDENRVMKLLRQIQADQAEICRDTREIKGRFIQMDGGRRGKRFAATVWGEKHL